MKQIVLRQSVTCDLQNKSVTGYACEGTTRSQFDEGVCRVVPWVYLVVTCATFQTLVRNAAFISAFIRLLFWNSTRKVPRVSSTLARQWCCCCRRGDSAVWMVVCARWKNTEPPGLTKMPQRGVWTGEARREERVRSPGRFSGKETTGCSKF